MAAKEERDHEDQHVAHVAFKILAPRPEYMVSKNREQIPNLQHQAVFSLQDICSSINDGLAEIDENAEDAYEQLKALLMSRYTMDRWARGFELHKFSEIGDMEPSEMIRQMKALLPPDSPAGTYFMAAFLLSAAA
jgi:hypothetical protein